MNKNSQPLVVLVTSTNRGMGMANVKYYLNGRYSVIVTYKDIGKTKELNNL